MQGAVFTQQEIKNTTRCPDCMKDVYFERKGILGLFRPFEHTGEPHICSRPVGFMGTIVRILFGE